MTVTIHRDHTTIHTTIFRALLGVLQIRKFSHRPLAFHVTVVRKPNEWEHTKSARRAGNTRTNQVNAAGGKF